MTEAVDTVVSPEVEAEPVTDVREPVKEAVKSETNTPTLPEFKDGKWYLEGKRFYTRDETNMVSAKARNEAINGLLTELEVDSLDQVKDVISTLKNTPLTEEGESSLDVRALKQAVAKREQTVEELTFQVNQLKTDLLLKDHVGQLTNHMPSAWNADQRQAVLDLMSARGMFAVENNTFQLRDGDEFLTVDGEKPDYENAVMKIGRQLGLPQGKKGVDVVNAEQSPKDSSTGAVKGLDEGKLNSDPEYRAAYFHIRQYNTNMKRGDVTHNQVMKQVEKTRKARQG